MRILRREGLAIDVVYSDLNIGYLFQFGSIESIYIDQSGNKTLMRSGPFWPKNNRWGLTKWVRAYVANIRDYINQYGAPDLIHTHTYLGAMVALELQKHITIPYIVTEHYTGWMDSSIRKHHKALGIAALNGAKKVLSVSHALKDAMQPWITQEVEVSPNFIDFEVFKPNAIRKSNVFEILGVGDLIPRKQWDQLIKAYAPIHEDLGSSKLKIIGEGPLRGELEGLIRSLKMESHIHLVGRKNKQEVALAMQKSSVLVHTSHTETFGLIYLEALACGLPVISYENGGINEFRDIKGVFILRSETIAKLSQAIIQEKRQASAVVFDELTNQLSGIDRIKSQYISLLFVK